MTASAIRSPELKFSFCSRDGSRPRKMAQGNALIMHAGVACGTEGNQVLLAIVAGLAAKFLVMNLKI